MSIWKEIKKGINSDFINEPLDTKITAVGTKVDTVDTVVDTISTNVGSDADVSSATGSVHAKIKDLKSSTTTAFDTYISGEYYSAAAATVTYYTVLDYSGSGILNRASGSEGASANNVGFRITIDGVAFTLSFTAGGTASVATNTVALFPNLRFLTSCKVEVIKTNAGSGTLGGFAEISTIA